MSKTKTKTKTTSKEKTEKARRNVLRTIRKLIGPGKTFSDCAQEWMTFARGKKSWNTALKNITKKFGQSNNHEWIIPMDDFGLHSKVTVVLNPYEKGTNNIVDIIGLYW